MSTSRARRRPRHEHTAARVCLNTPRRVRARSAQTPGSKHHNFPSTGARSLQMARPAELPAPLQTRRRPLVEHRTGAGAAAPHVPWYTTALVSALAAARSAACAARGSVRHRVHPWPWAGVASNETSTNGVQADGGGLALAALRTPVFLDKSTYYCSRNPGHPASRGASRLAAAASRGGPDRYPGS